MYDIPSNYCIDDNRIKTGFKIVTFSNYKRNDVNIAFKTALIKSNLEEAIRWMVELNCSGYNKLILDAITEVYLKYININNVLFYVYLNRQIKQLYKIVNKYPKSEELHMRNLQEVRNLFAELTAICVLSKKNNLFIETALPKINRNKLFSISELKKHQTATDLSNVYKYIYETDSKELKLALNEIIYNLNSQYGSYKECIFWYEWLEKVENILKKRDEKFKCRETNLKVPEDYKKLWIFKIWEILDNIDVPELVRKYINKFFLDYLDDFRLVTIRKKKYLLYICFYICKNYNFITNMEPNEHLVIQTVANINKMYYSISKNIILNNNSYDCLVNPVITCVNSNQNTDDIPVTDRVSINRNTNTVSINRNIDQEYEFEDIIEEEAVKKTKSEIKLDYFKSIISKKS